MFVKQLQHEADLLFRGWILEWTKPAYFSSLTSKIVKSSYEMYNTLRSPRFSSCLSKKSSTSPVWVSMTNSPVLLFPAFGGSCGPTENVFCLALVMSTGEYYLASMSQDFLPCEPRNLHVLDPCMLAKLWLHSPRVWLSLPLSLIRKSRRYLEALEVD